MAASFLQISKVQWIAVFEEKQREEDYVCW
jgi:hypothetical protein